MEGTRRRVEKSQRATVSRTQVDTQGPDHGRDGAAEEKRGATLRAADLQDTPWGLLRREGEQRADFRIDLGEGQNGSDEPEKVLRCPAGGQGSANRLAAAGRARQPGPGGGVFGPRADPIQDRQMGGSADDFPSGDGHRGISKSVGLANECRIFGWNFHCMGWDLPRPVS